MHSNVRAKIFFELFESLGTAPAVSSIDGDLRVSHCTSASVRTCLPSAMFLSTTVDGRKNFLMVAERSGLVLGISPADQDLRIAHSTPASAPFCDACTCSRTSQCVVGDALTHTSERLLQSTPCLQQCRGPSGVAQSLEVRMIWPVLHWEQMRSPYVSLGSPYHGIAHVYSQ